MPRIVSLSSSVSLNAEELQKLRSRPWWQTMEQRPQLTSMKWRRVRMPRLICKDGEALSVQAGKYLYCTPATSEGPWTEYEVGFPSVTPPDSWKDFAEDWENPCNTIYMRVPLLQIEIYIAAHGGVNYEATFPDGFSWDNT